MKISKNLSLSLPPPSYFSLVLKSPACLSVSLSFLSPSFTLFINVLKGKTSLSNKLRVNVPHGNQAYQPLVSEETPDPLSEWAGSVEEERNVGLLSSAWGENSISHASNPTAKLEFFLLLQSGSADL